MLPIPGRYFVIAVLLAVVAWASIGSQSRIDPAEMASVSSQVQALKSGNAAIRRRAAEELLQAGEPVIPELIKQIHADPEDCQSLVHVLSDMAVLNEKEAGEAALTAIEELTASDEKNIAETAWEALSENLTLRRRRAIEALQALGASIGMESDSAQQDSGRINVEYAVLGENFRGDATSLKYLRRLNVLHILYLSEKVNITLEQVEDLRRWYPRLIVSQESNGCLGIVGAMPFGSMVIIDQVIPGSPAARIGLRSGDQILSIDHVEEPTLRQMVATISSHAPGDHVNLTILRRDEKVMTFRIRCGTDFGTARCQCVDQ